jgi:hypothetical protein
VILLLQGGGFVFLLLFQQMALKAEMHSEILKGDLTFEQLSMSSADYQRALVDEHEISWKGKLFDVKEIVVLHNRVVLTVVNDTKEENILRELKEFLHRSCRNNKSLPERSAQLFLMSYIGSSYAGVHFSNFCCDLSSIHLPDFFVNSTVEVFTPPPKLIA